MKSFKDFYPNEKTRKNMLDMYVELEGTYVLSFENNFLLAYTCDESDTDTIKLDGKCLFIKYFEGSLVDMMEFLDPDSLDYIMFQRNGKGKIRKYDVKQFINKLL